jgi:hypothetical protein
MSARVLRCCCLVLALLISGGHLAVLQGVAWAGMIAARAPEQGLAAAVQSLDGSAPCQLCRTVRGLDQDSERGTANPAPNKPDATAMKPVKDALPMSGLPDFASPATMSTFAVAWRHDGPRFAPSAPEPPPPQG